VYRYRVTRQLSDGTQLQRDFLSDPFAREFGVGKLSSFTLGYSPYGWSMAEASWRTPAQADLMLYELNLAEFAADLERAEQELPTESRESYRRMVRSKGADAMAQLDGESCGGCCQQLPPNAVAELSQGRVVPCRSCGRMVYASRSD
jgi:hypothetical protein